MTPINASPLNRQVQYLTEMISRAAAAAPTFVEISVSHPDGLSILHAIEEQTAQTCTGARRELRWLKGAERYVSLRALNAQGGVVEQCMFPLEASGE